MRELTEEEKEDIRSKIEWEGFDYWLTEGYAHSQLEGTKLEALVDAVTDAKIALDDALREEEIIDW